MSIRYRRFLNSDPPHIAEVWRACGDQHGLIQPITVSILDSEVLAKPYFDPHGLILAESDDAVVGFAHAGFGPNESMSGIDYDLGVISMVAVPRHPQQSTIEDGLYQSARDYLYRAGAKVLYGGEMAPLAPFYFGLYGGSEMPGVLATDQPMNELFRRTGFDEAYRCVMLQCELFGFRPKLDRQFMQNRRAFEVRPKANPPTANWWQACAMATIDRTRFELVPRRGGEAVGCVTFWDMETFSASRGVASVGLIELYIEPEHRQKGYATFLVAESLRQLQELGVKIVEAQTMEDNQAALRLYEKLGFTEFNRGCVYRLAANA